MFRVLRNVSRYKMRETNVIWPPSFYMDFYLFSLEIHSINCKIQQKIVKEHEQDNK